MCGSWVCLAALVCGALGCTADQGLLGRPAIPDYARFEHSSAGRHVTIYWDCVRTETGSLRLEGVGLNRWEPVPPRYLDFLLSAVDAQGRVLSRTRGSAQGGDLLLGFPAPFRLELQEDGSAARVDLVYQYQYFDDSLDRFARRFPSYMTYQVRDACGSGAHRNRS